jgi:hypothetical protein
MVTRPSGDSSVFKANRRQIQLIYEHIDDVDGAIFSDIIVDARGQKKLLATVTSFDETTYPTPPDDEGDHTTSGRFHTAFTMTGTSSEANVTDTKVWQLAFLPSTVAYCGATPIETLPFLGSAMSAVISQAFSTPTRTSESRHNVASSGAPSHPCSD